MTTQAEIAARAALEQQLRDHADQFIADVVAQTGKEQLQRTWDEIKRQADPRNKQDYILPANHLVMSDDLSIHLEPMSQTARDLGRNPRWEVTQSAHGDFASTFEITIVYYRRMQAKAKELLAHNLNHWLKRSQRNLLIRVLDQHIRAVLSDRFRVIDNYDAAIRVLALCPELEMSPAQLELSDTQMHMRLLRDGWAKKLDAQRQLQKATPQASWSATVQQHRAVAKELNRDQTYGAGVEKLVALAPPQFTVPPKPVDLDSVDQDFADSEETDIFGNPLPGKPKPREDLAVAWREYETIGDPDLFGLANPGMTAPVQGQPAPTKGLPITNIDVHVDAALSSAIEATVITPGALIANSEVGAGTFKARPYLMVADRGAILFPKVTGDTVELSRRHVGRKLETIGLIDHADLIAENVLIWDELESLTRKVFDKDQLDELISDVFKTQLVMLDNPQEFAEGAAKALKLNEDDQARLGRAVSLWDAIQIVIILAAHPGNSLQRRQELEEYAGELVQAAKGG